MKITKRFLAWSISVLFFASALIAARAQAQLTVDPNFNPNKILEDSEMLNYNSLGLSDIQNFLQNKGSFLANYAATNTNGVIKSTAEIIYDATHNNYDCEYNCNGVVLSSNPTNGEKKMKCKTVVLSDSPTEEEKRQKCGHITTVNPKLILVLLQKEASLIEDSNPPQNHLDWATGYGCPDNWACNPYYKGLGKQINSAALQFRAYMLEPQNYTYRAGQTYIVNNTINPYATAETQTMVITPQNQATASLYNYTPHVFNGNYNVYKLWQRYFPQIDRLYPDGSIIKGEGDPRIWLIASGQKRHFANWSAFASRFRPEQIVTVATNELTNYPEGTEIKFANYSLVQTPDKQIYLLVDKEKRPFANQTAFKKFGFNPAEIELAAATDLAGYAVGKTITATSTYVTGALLQDSKTGEIFYVQNGTRSAVDKILLPIKFASQPIVKVTTKELMIYATTTPIMLDEGTLARTSNYPTTYLISGGKKRPFTDDLVFAKLNYNPQNVITVSPQLLYNYELGESIR